MSEAGPAATKNFYRRDAAPHASRKILYHYTNYFGLAGIASSKELWCSKIQHLNDSSELQHGLNILAREARAHVSRAPALVNMAARTDQFSAVNLFVCSFTEAGDTLSQWRGYAGLSGVSIGFSFDALKRKAASANLFLRKCIYDDAEKRELAQQYLRDMIAANPKSLTDENFSLRLASAFLPTAALFKHQGFAEEHEWRLVSPLVRSGAGEIRARPTTSGVVPYTTLDLRTGEFPFRSETQPERKEEYLCIEEVKVGPSREQQLQMSSVSLLFDCHDAAVPTVSHSVIPFRLF